VLDAIGFNASVEEASLAAQGEKRHPVGSTMCPRGAVMVMDEGRNDGGRSRIEIADERLVVHLGPGSRLVRLSPSMLLIVEPPEGSTIAEKPEQPMDPGVLITCICSDFQGGHCGVQTETTGSGQVLVKCAPGTCSGECIRWTTDFGGAALSGLVQPPRWSEEQTRRSG
jgi:hypothetical protein